MKPCPFCGGEAQLKQHGVAELYYVFCVRIGCGATICNPSRKSQAVAAWNRRADEWVHVEDRLPETDEPVLLWTKPWEGLYYGWLDRSERTGARLWCDRMGEFLRGVTHWRPLPARPEDTDDE